jgi:hypothetical protein
MVPIEFQVAGSPVGQRVEVALLPAPTSSLFSSHHMPHSDALSTLRSNEADQQTKPHSVEHSG